MTYRADLRDLIEEIRRAASLSALVGRTVLLRPVGEEMRGRCPFDIDMQESLYVNDRTGFYHCYSCGAHGDAILWLTDQGLPFAEAVETLASQVGVSAARIAAVLGIPSGAGVQSTRTPSPTTKLLDVAATFFKAQLDDLQGRPARDWLDARGIGDTLRRRFRMGFAPAGRYPLVRALAEFSDELISGSGLVIELDGKAPFARLRDRVVLPVRDAHGRTIGFTGRLVGSGEPKFLPSPNSVRFDKARVLFNEDVATAAVARTGRLIVVAGVFDVVALAGVGIEEVVAPLGLAITREHLAWMWSQVEVPVVCFDANGSGRRSMARLALRAAPKIRRGRTLRFALLPEGMDPDDLIRARGCPAFEDAITRAVTLESVVVRAILDELRSVGELTERAALEKLGELCASIEDAGERGGFFLRAHAALLRRFNT